MVSRWFPLLAIALFLGAGCSSKPPQQYDAVIGGDGGGQTVEIPPEPILTGTGVGNLAGLVVDTFSKPLVNASVILVGTDLSAHTSKNGTFLLEGLDEGTYGAIASYRGLANATGTVIIRAGITTRAWFQLKQLPPPPPYHKTITFNGTVEVTSDPITGWGTITCTRCNMPFTFDPYLASVILEFDMPEDSPIPVQPFPDPFDFHNNTIGWTFSGAVGSSGLDWSGSGPNPLWARSDARMEGSFRLYLYPNTYPGPEVSRAFTVHVTTFYVNKAPAGWAYNGGSR